MIMDKAKECFLSYETYSRKIEHEINAIVSLRKTIDSIVSFSHFLTKKETIIQSLCGIEKVLRESFLFINKNCIKTSSKQSILLNTIGKESSIKPMIESTHLSSTIIPNEDKQFKCDDGDRDDDYHNKEDDSNNYYNQPITFKGRDRIFFIEESLHSNESFAKRIQPSTLSYPLTTEKDTNYDYHSKNNTNSNNDNESSKQPRTVIYRNKNNAESYQNAQDYIHNKQSSFKSIDILNDNHKEIIENSNHSEDINPKCVVSSQQKKYQIITPVIDACQNLLTTIDYESSINQPNPISASNNEPNKKNASKVADILMKLSTNQTLFNIILQLFGTNALDDLMSTPPNESLIKEVEASIKELERLEEEDKVKDSTKEQPKEECKPLIMNAIRKEYISFNNQSSKDSMGKNSLSLSKATRKRNRNLHDSMTLSSNKKATNADDLLVYSGFKSRKTKAHHNNLSLYSKSSSLNTSNYIDIASTYSKYQMPFSHNNINHYHKKSLLLKKASIPNIEIGNATQFNHHPHSNTKLTSKGK